MVTLKTFMEKVLIIDDELDLCLLMKTYFHQKKKYVVELAHTLTDGLSKIDKFSPDIVFLDNNLPDGLGWDHAPDILKKHPGVKLNLISAYHPNLPHVKITPNLKIWEKPISLKAIDVYLHTT
jgi:DNA-binding response OmpR family regulator